MHAANFIADLKKIISLRSKKIIAISFIPSGRRRYSKFYFRGANVILIELSRFSIVYIYLIKYLLKNNFTYFIFSDVPARNLLSCNQLIAQKKIFVVSWNGEYDNKEFEKKYSNCEYETLTLFDSNENTKIEPTKKIFIGIKSVTRGTKRQIFFAGQAEYSANNEFDYVTFNNIMEIFNYVEGLKNSHQYKEDSLLKIRHHLINRWRSKFISHLVRKHKKNMVLVGPNFLVGSKYLEATIHNEMPYAEILHAYENSRICIDFGSQCGLTALYPRSLEILESNASSLIQTKINNQANNIFSGIEKFRVFSDFNSLDFICERLLSMSDEDYASEGSKLLENYNGILDKKRGFIESLAS
jgi:hypothetical protein